MSDSLEVIDPVRFPGWDDLLISNADYSFFHTAGWAKVLRDSYGYTPHYFVAIRDRRMSILVPLMEVDSLLTGKRGISLPFSDYCDPFNSDGISFESVLERIVEYGRTLGWKAIQLRSRRNLFREVEPSACFFNHVLDLGEGEERLFSRFRDSTKRNIRKAGKEGVSVKISASSDSLEEFYRLNCMTRKDHGLPPQPFHFFRHIQEHLLAQGMGIMALGSYQGHTIAGCLYLHVGNKAYYKYGASNKKFQHLRANNLVMWEAIRWYSRNGYRTFCFGRTEPENEGLRQFKMGWGTKENPLYYYRYDLAKNQFVKDRLFIFGIHNKVFLHLPVSISKTIGTLLYKHMA